MSQKNDQEQPRSRREALKLMGAGLGLLLIPIGRIRAAGDEKPSDYDWDKHYWGYAVDTTKCIGCCACMRACRAENDVPEGYFRTWIERYQIGPDGKVTVDVATDDDFIFKELEGDAVNAFFVPKLCNHCEKSVCNQVCPVGAAYRTKDGVVLIDQDRCIGCGYCVQACPYAASSTPVSTSRTSARSVTTGSPREWCLPAWRPAPRARASSATSAIPRARSRRSSSNVAIDC